MRYALSLLGVAAASVLLLVSAAMNWRFGFGLGNSEFDSQIYGAASAAADILKALLPFFILWAFKQKNWLHMLAAMLVWTVCTSYSLTSSLGFAALNRADTVGERVLKATEYQDLRAELKRARQKAGWIPQHRSVGEVEAALTAALQKPIKRGRKIRGTVSQLTRNCSITNYWSNRFCGDMLNLRKELAIARDAVKVDQRIATINKKLASVNSASAVAEGDPQVAILTRISGIDAEKVQVALVVLVSMLVEIGSGLGFFVVLGNIKGRGEDATPVPQFKPVANDNTVVALAAPGGVASSSEGKELEPADEVKEFYEEGIEKTEGSSITASTLYENYCRVR